MAQSKALPDIDTQICIGIMRLGELEFDKLSIDRMVSIIQVGALCKSYMKEFHNNPLIPVICDKKIGFILQAKTKTELKEILSPPKVRYNYAEVVSIGMFHLEEEELLIWSLTSLWCGGPLNDVGLKRYMDLFNKFYPDRAWEVGEK